MLIPFVSARVGHGSHFLVLAGGEKGFWRLAFTKVVFVYGACCSRAGIARDFPATACLRFLFVILFVVFMFLVF
jgi:hypothetical protein